MSIQKIIRSHEQAHGSFDGGAIQELRPIIPSHPNGGMPGYGNLFYWAYAWSQPGGLVDLHPHKGFEIISYVIEGGIEHYDTKGKTWLPLHQGSLQVIRAGSGISHAERIDPGSAIFQIWFDPNLEVSFSTPASYNDYPADRFPTLENTGCSTTTIIGEGSPVQLKSQVEIYRVDFNSGKYTQKSHPNSLTSTFILDGTIRSEKELLNKGDFLLSEGDTIFESDGSGSVFIIVSPKKTDYKTYMEMMHPL